MIGASIGSAPIGGDFLITAPPIVTPNIFLSGTLDFMTSYRLALRVATYLNFTLITNDDNTIQVALANIITGQPISLSGASAIVSVYQAGVSAPIIVKDNSEIMIVGNTLQFTLSHSDVINLAAGNYPWIAIVNLADGTQHTVNCGDINLSTGIIRVVQRP